MNESGRLHVVPRGQLFQINYESEQKIILDDDLFPGEFVDSDRQRRGVSYYPFPMERVGLTHIKWLNILTTKITDIVAEINYRLAHNKRVYLCPTGSEQAGYLIEFAWLLEKNEGNVLLARDFMTKKYHSCVLSWTNLIRRHIVPKLESYYSPTPVEDLIDADSPISQLE